MAFLNKKSNKKYKTLEIMKKSFLIIGLFSLMMVLTSFTSPNVTGGRDGKGTDSGTGQYDTGGRDGKGTDSGTGQFDTGGRDGKGTDSGTGQYDTGGRDGKGTDSGTGQ